MTDEAVSPQEPKRGNWWKRRSKKAKVLIIAAALIAVIAIANGGNKKESTPADAVTPAASQTTTEAEPTTTAEAANNGPLVRGTWNGECNQFSAGDLSACKAIRATKVTCQWQEDHVHMAVTFRNTFGAHVTVHMNPYYVLKNAGEHGDGITATQDVGLDPGEVRTFETDQSPKGVAGTPAITLCRPKIDTLSGVELG
ncbi:MAG TPA: hypothetical protein VIL77_10280 [Gaiellaceae bacterium]